MPINRNWLNTDFYGVLHVARTATQEEITRAYRRASKVFHPDASQDATDTALQAQVNAAYEVLGNPVKRRVYDDHLKAVAEGYFQDPGRPAPPPKNPGARPPPDEQKDQAAAPPKGPDAQVRFPLTRKQLRTGGEFDGPPMVEFPCAVCGGTGVLHRSIHGESRCTNCAGTGVRRRSAPVVHFAVPSGSKLGQRIAIPEHGLPSPVPGGRSGDLVITLTDGDPSGSRRRWAGVALLLAVLLGGSLWLTNRASPGPDAAPAPTDLAAPPAGGSADSTPVVEESTSAEPGSTPQAVPIPTTEQEAESLLAATARADGPLLPPSGTWVPQVSSKCPALEQVDLMNESGVLGYADGRDELYPDGLGSVNIWLYHRAMLGRFGDVVLVEQTPSPELCRGTRLWRSWVVGVQSDSPEPIEQWCLDRGIPSPECAPHQIKPKSS